MVSRNADRRYAERVGTCARLDATWEGTFMQGQLPVGTTLKGDTYLDGKFGMQLDGEGDYATVEDVPAFTADGTFTVSLWFFKASECDIPEAFEFLFSTVQDGWQSNTDLTRVWSPQYYSGVHMFLACAEQGAHSTVEGDVLRTWLVDDSGNRATFDYSLSRARSGGAVTDGWIHVSLAVSSTALELYVDGELIRHPLKPLPPHVDEEGSPLAKARRSTASAANTWLCSIGTYGAPIE